MMFSYRHPERSRGIFLALWSLSHWHQQGNDALVLRISAFSHPSFIALQRRFLASLEMTIRESDVSQSPRYQSLEVPHPRFQTWIPHFPYRHRKRSRGAFLHCGQYHIGTVWKRHLGATYFCFRTSIVYRSAKKISRFARNDYTGV